MIFGHRGCKEKPENTILAFEYGLELGLKGFELVEGDNGLVVQNPPTVRFSNDSSITNEDLENIIK